MTSVVLKEIQVRVTRLIQLIEVGPLIKVISIVRGGSPLYGRYWTATNFTDWDILCVCSRWVEHRTWLGLRVREGRPPFPLLCRT